MKKIMFLLTLLIVILLTACTKNDKPLVFGKVTDVDGNVYKTVEFYFIYNSNTTIQTWMVENLKVLHYPDGTPINYVYAYNNDENNAKIYGRLYRYSEKNICPDGWHIPTQNEWDNMLRSEGVSGPISGGSDLKEAGTTHWLSPNNYATNKTGFTALPGGMRAGNELNGEFTNINKYGFWWTSTTGIQNNTMEYFRMSYLETVVRNYSSTFNDTWYSVRCMKN